MVSSSSFQSSLFPSSIRHRHRHGHYISGALIYHEHEHSHHEEHSFHSSDDSSHFDEVHAHSHHADDYPKYTAVKPDDDASAEFVVFHQSPDAAIATLAPASAPVNATEAAASQAALPVWKRKWFRMLIIRICIRATMISVLIYVSRFIPWRKLVNSYIDFLESLDPWPIPAILLFAACALPFCAYSPGSYAPTVLAGATFGIFIGAALSYVVMNASALLNFFTIRKVCGQGGCVRKCCGNRIGIYKHLDALLARQPIRTITLLRLPYLGCGVLNYVFSMSNANLTTRSVIIGNAMGFSLGSILFAVLGTQARSLGAVILNGSSDPGAITTVVLVAIAIFGTVFGLIWMVRKQTARMEAQIEATESTRANIGIDGVEQEVSQVVFHDVFLPITPILAPTGGTAEGEVEELQLEERNPHHDTPAPAAEEMPSEPAPPPVASRERTMEQEVRTTCACSH